MSAASKSMELFQPYSYSAIVQFNSFFFRLKKSQLGRRMRVMSSDKFFKHRKITQCLNRFARLFDASEETNSGFDRYFFELRNWSHMALAREHHQNRKRGLIWLDFTWTTRWYHQIRRSSGPGRVRPGPARGTERALCRSVRIAIDRQIPRRPKTLQHAPTLAC